jgi:hypothetical protein
MDIVGQHFAAENAHDASATLATYTGCARDPLCGARLNR